jgi:putative FmdB family regulatory protein
MPLYDYECSDCDVVTEDFRSIEDRDDELLCYCGEPMQRILSGGNFMLIGGGWSGNAHPIIHPPITDPNARTKPHDNYHNCTPESVREAMNRR